MNVWSRGFKIDTETYHKHTHRVNVKYCFEVKNAKHGDDAKLRSYI